LEEITRFVNLPVYTKNGTFVGNVKNLILDLPGRKLDAILVGKTNPILVEGGRDVSIPYRWVSSFDDVMILRFFPEELTKKKETPTDAKSGENGGKEIAA
jgi:sporulation protein YlmC with PRC-barrel domain